MLARNMPRYHSHKEVGALKIADVVKQPAPNSAGCAGATLFFERVGFLPQDVTAEWFNRHHPVAGGYFVVYEDGYQSFSPAKAFEDGYTLIEHAEEATLP